MIVLLFPGLDIVFQFMNNKHFALWLILPFVLLFWLVESAIHYFIFGEHGFEIFPHDINELWMRFLIISLLIVFGLVVDRYTNKILQKEAEKEEIYITMLNAAQHILNNFLNSMMLFKLKAEESDDFDKKVLQTCEKVIESTKLQIQNLEGINNPNKETIEKRYKPK